MSPSLAKPKRFLSIKLFVDLCVPYRHPLTKPSNKVNNSMKINPSIPEPLFSIRSSGGLSSIATRPADHGTWSDGFGVVDHDLLAYPNPHAGADETFGDAGPILPRPPRMTSNLA
jgi:hypothetical protein